MKIWKLIFPLLASCVLVFSVSAAENEGSNPLVPSPSLDILDFIFGQPITINECPSRMPIKKLEYDLFPSNEKRPCWKHTLSSKAPTSSLSANEYVSIVVKAEIEYRLHINSIGIKLIDGNIEEVTLYTDGHLFQEDIYNSLVEKYGQPTFREIEKNQNRMGANFNNITAVWRFVDLSVTFSGIVGRIDSGMVIISSSKADRAREIENIEKKKNKPKL